MFFSVFALPSETGFAYLCVPAAPHLGSHPWGEGSLGLTPQAAEGPSSCWKAALALTACQETSMKLGYIYFDVFSNSYSTSRKKWLEDQVTFPKL